MSGFAPDYSGLIAADEVEEEKASGNAAFKAGSFRQSIVHYSKAIERATFCMSSIAPDTFCNLYTNRAMALLRTGDADSAESDCDRALMMRPNALKAYYRRALARKLMCRFDSAVADLRTVLAHPEASEGEKADALRVLAEIDSELASLRLQEEVVYQRLTGLTTTAGETAITPSASDSQTDIEFEPSLLHNVPNVSAIAKQDLALGDEHAADASRAASLAPLPHPLEQKATIDQLCKRAGAGGAYALLPLVWYRAWKSYSEAALQQRLAPSAASNFNLVDSTSAAFPQTHATDSESFDLVHAFENDQAPAIVMRPLLCNAAAASTANTSSTMTVSEFYSTTAWLENHSTTALRSSSSSSSSTLSSPESDALTLRKGVVEGVDVVALPRKAVETLAQWYGLDYFVARGMMASIGAAELDAIVIQVQLARSADDGSGSSEQAAAPPALMIACSRLDSLDFIRRRVCSQWLLPASDCRWLYAASQLPLSEATTLIQDAVIGAADAAAIPIIAGDASATTSSLALQLQCRLPNGRWPSFESAQSSVDVVCNSASSIAAIASAIAPATLDAATACIVCQQPSVNKCSKCKAARYCSGRCQRAHWLFHKQRCGQNSEAMQRCGRVGLANIGNTCYMSAALQSLLRTRELVKYFVSDSFVADVNRSNPLGKGGKIAESFAAFCKAAQFGFDPVISPRAFKTEVVAAEPMFQGARQHDAQEFLGFLLEALHEDTNRVLDKPYITNRDSDGRPDAEVADEFWRGHLARNQSFTQDCFGGQTKNATLCPECEHESVRFDPFFTLALQLPPLQPRVLSVILHLRLRAATVDGASAPVSTSAISTAPAASQIGASAQESTLTPIEAFCAAACADSPAPLRLLLPVSPLATIAQVKELACARVLELAEQALLRARGEGAVSSSLMEAARVAGSLHVGGLTAAVIVGSRFTKVFKDARSIDDFKSGDELVLFQVQCASLLKRQATGVRQIRFLFRRRVASADTLDRSSLLGSCFLHDFEPSELLTGTSLRAAVSAHLGKFGAVRLDDFTLHLVDKSGIKCSECPQKFAAAAAAAVSSATAGASDDDDHSHSNSAAACQGCLLDLVDLDEQLPLLDRQYIAVEFAPDAPAIEWKQQPPTVIYQHPQIKRDSVTLGDCFELYMSSEQLEAGWFCSKCKTHVAPSKKTEIWRLPSILVLTLKRFSHNAISGRSSKIHTPVDFPLRGLDLSPYLPADQRADTPLYDLFSVMNHHGAMGFGHYTAAVHGHVDGAVASSSPTSASAAASDESGDHDDSWTLCDDESIEALASSSVVTKDAYVLFYRRRQ